MAAPPAPASPSVFVSYARSDDEPFVRQLVDHLRSVGFVVWFDRDSMPSRSLTFFQEIRDAIRSHDRLLVVLGPQAVRSDYVRAEWQAALVEGRPVTPVLRLGDYDQLPPELANFHCLDVTSARPLSDALGEVVGRLRDPVPPLGELIGAIPNQPPHFQPRPDDLTRLAGAVLYEVENPTVTSPPERVVVLRGMGGVGKSVMASAMARSTSTRRVFRDGVIWVSLEPGRMPLDVARSVASAMGLSSGAAGDLAATITEMRTWLAERRCLIVLDNAWSVDQVVPVLQSLSPVSRALVTTRDGGIATGLGAVDVTLETLHTQAALVQLADWVGVPAEDLPAQALEVADQCGGLPFALSLQGALARDGVPWSDLLGALQDAELDYARQELPGYPHHDVLASLQVSVDMLRRRDATGADRFSDLGAFFWGDGVPADAVISFWHGNAALSRRRGQRLLVELERFALLRLDGPLVRMHDLVADYVSSDAASPARRSELLDTYRERSGGNWASLTGDGYVHRHLLDHLAASGESSEIEPLLRMTTPEGRNAWFESCDRAGELVGYRQQLERRMADDDASAEEVIRLGLLVSSANALAVNVTPILANALVDAGVWTTRQALDSARRLIDPSKRAEGLAGLLPLLSEREANDVIDEALFAARATEEVGAGLLPLVEALAARARIDDALALARRAPAGDAVGAALAVAVPYLEEAEREAVVDEAIQTCAATPELFRGACVGALLPRLADAEIEQLRLDAVDPMQNVVAKGWCEAGMAAELARRGNGDAARAIADSVADPLSLASALSACGAADDALAVLSSIDLDLWLEGAVAAFSDLPKVLFDFLPHLLRDQPLLAEALEPLVDSMTPQQVETAVQVIRATADPAMAAEAVAVVAPAMASPMLDELVARIADRAPSADDMKHRIRTMAALARAVPSERVDEAMDEIRLAPRWYRADGLVALAPALDRDGVREAVALASLDRDDDGVSKVADALVPACGREELELVKALVTTVGDSDAVLLAGSALGVGASDLRRRLLGEIEHHPGVYVRARAIALLAPDLDADSDEAVDRIVSGLDNPTSLAEAALPPLVRAASGDRRQRLLDTMVEVAASMSDPSRRVWALEAFIGDLDEAEQAVALDRFEQAEEAIDDDWRAFGRALFLAVVAAHSDETLRDTRLDEALDLVTSVDDVGTRRDVLCRVSDVLAPDDIERWTRIGDAIDAEADPHDRAVSAGFIVEAAPAWMTGRLVEAALVDFDEIGATDYSSATEQQEGALARILPYVGEPEASIRIVDERFETSRWKRASLLSFIGARHDEILAEIVRIGAGLPDATDRAIVALAVAKLPVGHLRPRLLGDALGAALEGRPDLLHDHLLPQLSAELCKLGDGDLAATWGLHAPSLAQRGRPQALAFLHGLAPVLHRLGIGQQSAEAILDVRDWWP